jgi:SAM-dependent methyltransferase
MTQEKPGRVEREREFYETKDEPFFRERALIEKTLKGSRRANDIASLYDPTDKTVLDFGCGHGEFSFELRARGARRVVGIDISDKMLAEARARQEQLQDPDVTFMNVDGHATGLPDDGFDLIVGRAVLHHMDLDRALREIHRLLRPGGSAYFAEPLWHNPILRIGRALTPNARTRDEHPLTEDDWALCRSVFPQSTHEEREFLSLFLTPLRPLLPQRWVTRLDAVVARYDDRLLRSRRWAPRVAKYCRVTLLTLPKEG